MVVEGEKLKSIAERQWVSTVKIDAKRGRILDRKGNELAISANVYRVDLDMNTLRETLRTKNSSNEIIAPQLAKSLDMKQEDVLKILNTTLPNGLPIASANLKRRIEKEQADAIRELKLDGIIVSPDTKRYYPNDNLLSHVLGHTNIDGAGLTGIEKQYNSILAGTPGVLVSETDLKGKDLPYSISKFTKPIDGKDIKLSIDETIQYFCEEAALQALKDNKAKTVSIMVMDPKTGEVLAMANKPDYNPNNPWEGSHTSDELQKLWRNRCVSDTFEPGSIFKVITAVAAIEENAVSSSDKFQCNGSTTIGKNTIKCWKTSGHGTQSFVDILKNSCNMGFIQVGEKLGKDRLYTYIDKLEFGKKTGIDLPGEANGIIKKLSTVTNLDLATISFGQTNTVSMIQYLTAFNAVANGGYLITPHLLKDVVTYDKDNKEIVESSFKYDKKKVLNENSVATLRSYLEQVVSDGGSKNAFIEGYHIAGKTGTAKKIGPRGGYEENKYISSFAGMAPANDPRITIMISIDEPDPAQYYAGQIAAPVAKTLFNNIFNYLALKPDASGEEVAKSLLRDVLVPNARGMKKNDAIKLLKDNKLNFQTEGTGEYIKDCSPVPGFTTKEGTKIILYLGETPNYNNNDVVVPNLRGMNREQAIAVLNSVGLKASFEGEGLVGDQSFKAGDKTQKGATVKLSLEFVGD